LNNNYVGFSQKIRGFTYMTQGKWSGKIWSNR
jgi:hypothetical protein